MSAELHVEEGTNNLEVTLSGKLSRADYETFVPEVERLIRDRGNLRILCTLHDFHGWTLGAVWEDIKFDVRHFSQIERLALVGDRRWEAGMAVFCKPFTSATIRYFDTADAAKAAEWIHEGAATASAK
jgi:hypothetical protein